MPIIDFLSAGGSRKKVWLTTNQPAAQTSVYNSYNMPYQEYKMPIAQKEAIEFDGHNSAKTQT